MARLAQPSPPSSPPSSLRRATSYHPNQCCRRLDLTAPDGYKLVTDVLSLKELEDIAANYKRVAGFQVEGLNAKPPIVQLPDARRAS